MARLGVRPQAKGGQGRGAGRGGVIRSQSPPGGEVRRSQSPLSGVVIRS